MSANANAIGVAGLVASVLGLAAIWFANIGLVLVVAGVGLSVVGITKAEQGQATNKPVAVAGLVCGGAAMLVWLGVLVVSVLG
ncbi:hypothetical protein [Actinokineospora terrae]|uniref:DUF4190 domain-containing protein n=1 Tax=Actinokineospora terrae TaxID=155974 RepID=A0A1H9SCH2_9PSEU|nr:hypothetical protein [Actinokineospora terrae]SER82275.1 hypothetical protein SAMN04487818_105373 [Actinokineospora terrae]